MSSFPLTSPRRTEAPSSSVPGASVRQISQRNACTELLWCQFSITVKARVLPLWERFRSSCTYDLVSKKHTLAHTNWKFECGISIERSPGIFTSTMKTMRNLFLTKDGELNMFNKTFAFVFDKLKGKLYETLDRQETSRVKYLFYVP